jgi:PAS domain S-box-containing protein
MPPLPAPWLDVPANGLSAPGVEAGLPLFRQALEAVGEGIVITDRRQPDNPILYVNPAFERITGYSAAEVLGRNCRFLRGPDTDPTAVERIRQAVAAGQPCAVEVLSYRKDGRSFWNGLSLTPLPGPGRRVEHFVMVLNDVTARRHAQERQARLEEELRQAQKMEAVGRLAAGVAHDFNNMLTVITGYVELLQSGSRRPENVRTYLQQIARAGERASALTRQLLAFSRKQTVQTTVVDVNDLVKNLDKMLRRLIGEDVELAVNVSHRPAPVRGDPGQLEQVIMNLVVNARDAMPTGGRLTVQTTTMPSGPHVPARSGETPPGPYVVLSVSDTGVGMSEEVKARIFEPFFTTKEHSKGTGLGLATVHGIVQQSGGQLEVDSAPGHGTTFRVWLPRVTEPQAARPATPAPVCPRGTETILLVEDEGPVRLLARDALTLSGYRVLEAANGGDAVRVYREHVAGGGPLDLVVSDVVMPGVGARELTEFLRREHPGLKLLFMSGYTEDAVLQHGILSGAVPFIQKPFTPLALVRRVREVLDAGPPSAAPSAE